LPKFRLFISLNPESGDLVHLKDVFPEIKKDLESYPVKWIEPDKFHMTLRFLGDVEEQNIEPLACTLDRLKFDFELIEFSTDKIGFFPDSRYPNVIYAGLLEKGNSAEQLVSFIDRIILNFGVKPEKRFVPHITLGRFSRDKRKKIEPEFSFPLKPENVIFRSFSLMKSSLRPEGPVYEELYKFNFLK